MTQPSNRGRKRRCPNDQYGPCMEFVYSGPFHVVLRDTRLGRSFLKPTRDFIGRIIEPAPRYSAPAENYTIGSALGREVVRELEARFGRETRSAPARRRGGRRRSGVTKPVMTT
jgi:hypothetical protein